MRISKVRASVAHTAETAWAEADASAETRTHAQAAPALVVAVPATVAVAPALVVEATVLTTATNVDREVAARVNEGGIRGHPSARRFPVKHLSMSHSG